MGAAAHVDEHLAVAERVELRLAFGPRRVRRDRLEDAEVAVQDDARVVRRAGEGAGSVGVVRRRGVVAVMAGPSRSLVRCIGADRRTVAVVGALRGVWVCSIGRTPPPGDRAASSGRKKSLRSGKLW